MSSTGPVLVVQCQAGAGRLRWQRWSQPQTKRRPALRLALQCMTLDVHSGPAGVFRHALRCNALRAPPGNPQSRLAVLRPAGEWAAPAPASGRKERDPDKRGQSRAERGARCAAALRRAPPGVPGQAQRRSGLQSTGGAQLKFVRYTDVGTICAGSGGRTETQAERGESASNSVHPEGFFIIRNPA
jgi:hypothetical protein